MTQLLGDESQRAELARKARQRAETAFNWDTITRSYEALFAQLG
jgi:glycosyltransferase involved in cell wall biosynthesis